MNRHLIKVYLPFVFGMAFFISCSAETDTVMSPDGTIELIFEMSNGRPGYYVTHHGSTVLGESRLGLILNDVDFSKDMSLERVSNQKMVKEEYTLQHGKQREISYTAQEKTVHMRHQTGKLMGVIFRVSDDGVAFRYHFPEENEEQHSIEEEKTTFNFPETAKAWLEPLANVNTGWSRTNPSYEEYYHKNIDVGTAAPDSAGWAWPALFNTGSSWILLTETGMDGTYAGTRLRQEAPDGEYQIGFPQEGEQFPGRALYPQSSLPWSSPWRIITIGDLKTITESTLGTDLAYQAVSSDTSWIRPGRASWSWAKLKDESVNYDTQKEFIDYAADMNWEYTLVDVNWDSTIGYARIAELANYAATKNVGLLLWYNSSGSWNDTEYRPKSRLLTGKERTEEFSKIQDMGIRGVKVDFFAGDGQSMMKYYIDIFEDAARHNLMVNTHGTTLPRGWHRTFPNLMTMESVKGFEFITFEQENADQAAAQNTMLPFTRNVFDPMDYTPMSLYDIPGINRKTTAVHELALSVLFTSGIQHFAETPEGMSYAPDYVKNFLRDVPVSWDEMHFIDGYPGEFAMIARRKGNRWYVAGINGEDNLKERMLDFSFLPDNAEALYIEDGEERNEFSRRMLTIPEDKNVKITMRGNGGFVMLFEI